MSDTFRAAVFVTLSGGFQDAYTYISRGQVFANAQTGNIVLLSAALLRGDWAVCLKYLTSDFVLRARDNGGRIHPYPLPQFPAAALAAAALLQEIVFLCAVGFLPHTLDPLANALVSFVCAMQVHTFHKIHGHVYASTMCIGNLRCAAEALGEYLRGHNRASLDAAKTYFGVILCLRRRRRPRQSRDRVHRHPRHLGLLRIAAHQLHPHVHPRRSEA